MQHGTPSPYQQGPPPQPGFQDPSHPPYGQQSPPMQPPGTPGMFFGSGTPDVGGLSSGMSGMNLGVPEQQVAGHGGTARKKKGRAYHTLDSSSLVSHDAAPAAGFMGQSPPIGHETGGGFVTPGFQQQPPPMGQPPYGQPQFGAPAPSPYMPPGQYQSPGGVAPSPGGFNSAPPGQLGEYSAAIKPATGAGPGSQQRVDPDDIPSVPEAREAAQKQADTMIYPTLERHLPPPATADFMAHDQGNSSPKFARLTLNNVPATAELLATTGLPLSLILTPLAPQKPEEGPVPVLDFGDVGPPRCRRCRTYINPFMQFTASGSKFVCNMCLFPNNEVSPEYFSPIDNQGRRIDRDTRPELSRGTVEFVVPKEYWAKPPTPLRWLFLIETSKDAIDKGWVDVVARAIKSALYDGVEVEEELDENGEAQIKGRKIPKGARIGIVTFDRDIGFYNLSVSVVSPGILRKTLLKTMQPKLEAAQMLMMTDLEEPFVPLEDGLFVDPYESRYVTKMVGD